MANKNAPYGFRVVKHLNGSPYNGQFNMYFIPATDATNTFVGDIVKLTGTDDGKGVQGVTTITAVADTPVGLTVGFSFDPDNLMLKYRKASTARYAYIVDATDIVMTAQDSGTTATGDPGLNAQPLIAAGSTATGVSGFQIDGTTKATTSTHMLKLLRVVQSPGVELGANGQFECGWNRHALGFAVAGV